MARLIDGLSDDEQRAYRRLVRMVRKVLAEQSANDSATARDAGREAFRKAIGEAILVIRMHRGASQIELARALSKVTNRTVPQSHVSRVEAGKKGVGSKQLAAFCKVLNCSVDRVYSLAAFMFKQNLKVEKEVLKQIIKRTI